jgi:hypothetical protein
MPQVPAAARGGIVNGGTEKQTPNVQNNLIGAKRDGNLKGLRQFGGNPHPAFAAVQPHFAASASVGILLPAGWHAGAPAARGRCAEICHKKIRPRRLCAAR